MDGKCELCFEEKRLGDGNMILEISVRKGELYNEGGGSKYSTIFFPGYGWGWWRSSEELAMSQDVCLWKAIRSG